MKNKISHSNQGQLHIARMTVYKGHIKHVKNFFKSIQGTD